PAAHRTLAGAARLDVGPCRLQAAAVLPRRHADQHLLHDATIQRVRVRKCLKCRQRDFLAVGPHAWPADLHLSTAEHDLTRDRAGARRFTHLLVLVPWPT